ncbi:hypothetical protein P9112_013056 [Eukaryota sp. TZLM1-RC]
MRHILLICLLAATVLCTSSSRVVYVNTVFPQHSVSTRYQFYSLPYCRPPKLILKLMSLGEVLQGHRYIASPYQIPFKMDVPKTPICTSDKPIPVKGLRKFIKAVDNEYWHEMMLDDLPMWGPVGFINSQKTPSIYTDFHFYIFYNQDDVVGVNVTLSKTHSFPLPRNDLSPVHIPFSYQVTWLPTKVQYDQRFDIYGSALTSSMKIHWFSIINSTSLVIIGVVLMTGVLLRVLRKDVMRYNKASEALPTSLTIDEFDLQGWKSISPDVFRPPKKLSFLIAFVATGLQLLSTLALSLIVRLFFSSSLKPYAGSSVSLLLFLFVLSSSIGGTISGYLYKRIGGKDYALNLVVQSVLYSVPALFIIFSLSFIALGSNVTHSLSFSTVLLLVSLLLFVSFPLSIVTGLASRKFTPTFSPPVKVSPYPKPIPGQPWFRSRKAFGVVAGLLPFSAIFLELSFVMSSFWSNNIYQLYGVLVVIAISLLVVVISVTLVLTYFQLSAGDYRWWTSAFFYGGSTAIFVWFYCLLYYIRSEMSGTFQFFYFIGYTFLGCYGLYLILGSVAWMAVFVFINKAYGSIKTD